MPGVLFQIPYWFAAPYIQEKTRFIILKPDQLVRFGHS